MNSRTKLLTLAVLALLLAAGLWLLNRPQSATSKGPSAQSAEAAAPAAAVTESIPTISAPPASPASPVGITPPPATVQFPAPAVPSTPAASAFQPFSPSAGSPHSSSSPEPQAREELAATARMFAAHAPLRTREVADPDSETNRRILGTMVSKLVTQPADAAPVKP